MGGGQILLNHDDTVFLVRIFKSSNHLAEGRGDFCMSTSNQSTEWPLRILVLLT